MPQLTSLDFASAFGTTPDAFSSEVLSLIDSLDFRYEAMSGAERDAQILNVLKRIESDKQAIGVPERRDVWERGWAENLEAFLRSGRDPKALIPKFLRADQPLRWRGDYIMSPNPRFELDFITVFRTWIYQNFFTNAPALYEFGAGTGFNLALMEQLIPGKQLWGLDFVPSAVELISQLGTSQGCNLRGRLFDMTAPDPQFRLQESAAVMTFGSLEQLAGKFNAFLDYLLEQLPAIVIHVEPTVELYDGNSLFDWLALRFHQKRGYTEGLLPRLRELSAECRVELLQVNRVGFGSLFMEGYTLIAWRPVAAV
jgi:hypothetical protein